MPRYSDEELDRAEWLIRQGRVADGLRIVDRREAGMQKSVIGWKLTTRVPEVRAIAVEFENKPVEEAASVDWPRVDQEAYRDTWNLLDAGGDPDKVKSDVTGDLAFKFDIPDDVSHPDRKRLYRKVCEHVERWQRKQQQVAANG